MLTITMTCVCGQSCSAAHVYPRASFELDRKWHMRYLQKDLITAMVAGEAHERPEEVKW